MRPVVVVGGYTPGLAVIRALGSRGVPVVVARYDKRDMGQASKFVHEWLDCPHPESGGSRFVEFLAGLAARYPGAMLVPASDQALAAVAASAGALARAGYVVAAPDDRVARACLDKADTYLLAECGGVPSPATAPVRGVADIERYAARAPFPAVLKPKLSHRYYAVFGRKWTRVDGPEHAVAEYRLARDAGLEVILQELVPGDELCGANYNAYFWGGEPLVEMTAGKIRNSPSETGSPCVTVSRDLPEVLEPGRAMLRALDYHGFANIEFKRDPRDGEYKIIEVNARHHLSAGLAYHAGINFPWMQYRHLVYGELPEQPAYRHGLYWIDITRDLKEAMSYLRRGDYTLRRFLRPYFAPHVAAVWDPDDRSPARVRAWDTVRTLA
ncbi:MAG: ATP-grasp domain-containing protein, partial [Pseudonocardia sp.]|nr:ATP-grasp domain-containing protein [Pseudonocardia sp.]